MKNYDEPYIFVESIFIEYKIIYIINIIIFKFFNYKY